MVMNLRHDEKLRTFKYTRNVGLEVCPIVLHDIPTRTDRNTLPCCLTPSVDVSNESELNDFKLHQQSINIPGFSKSMLFLQLGSGQSQRKATFPDHLYSYEYVCMWFVVHLRILTPPP